MRRFATVLTASLGLVTAAPAWAHFKLAAPAAVNAADNSGKGAPPCGPDTADGTLTPVTGGGQFMLHITETVRHGGFYRVALATKSCKMDGCFPVDNKVYDASNMPLNPMGPGTSDHADWEMNPKFPILADHLFPHDQAGAAAPIEFMQSIDVPNFNCDRCTLEVIEFMAPHGPNAGGGYFYHHCADLKITADAGKPIFDPMNPGGGGMGGAGGMAGSGGASLAGAGGIATGGTGGASGGSAGGATGGASAGASTAGATSGGVASGGTGGAAAGTAATGATSSDDGGCTLSNARGAGTGASGLALLGVSLLLWRRRRAS